jgi:hypothetical protein
MAETWTLAKREALSLALLFDGASGLEATLLLLEFSALAI